MKYILNGVAVLLLIFVPNLFATVQVDVSIRDLSIAQGLSQSTVYCVYQDSRGLLWIGTQGGLNVYDGTKIRVFRHDPDDVHSLPHDEVYGVAEDEDGNLIAATINGLARLNPATGEVVRYSVEGQQPGEGERFFFSVVHRAKNGTFWAASFNGVHSFDVESGAYGTIIQTEGEFQRVNALYEDKLGRIWFGTRPANIYIHDPSNGRTKKIELPEEYRSEIPPNQQLFRFAFSELKDGRMLVGASLHGLYYLDLQTDELTPVNSALNDMIRQQRAVITDVQVDDRDRMWVGTFGAGLIRLSPDGQMIHAYNSSNAEMYGFDSDHLVDMHIDNTGTLWIGTVDRGVKQVRFDDFERVLYAPTEEMTLSDKVAGAVFEDSDGILWVGHFHSLDRIDLKNRTSTSYERLQGPGGPIVLNNVSWIRELDDNTLLLTGMPQGLLKLDKRTMRAEKISASPLVFNVHWRDPSRAWYTAINMGFFRINLLTGEQKQYTSLGEGGVDLSGRFVIFAFEDSGGTLWLGTNDGLFSFDPESETGRSYRYDPSNSGNGLAVRSNDIISINEDSRGIVWVSTGGGLFGLADGNVVYEYTTDNGLPDNMVYSSIDDGTGLLWVGTNNGLVRLDPTTGEAFEFNMGHGLPSREFNQAAAFQGADGRIYFGTMNGVVWFNPSEVAYSTFEPPVYITDIVAGEHDFEVPVFWQDGESLTLPWKERDLTFNFTALDYSRPDQIKFRYMLDGYDTAWRYTAGMPHAIYTNVPSGSFVFRVQATNADGVWGSKEANFSFQMSPPWWGSWWFIGLQVAFAAALFFGAVYIVTTHARRQKNTLERKIAEATSELRAQHAELTIANRELEMFNYSVSHDLRSPLHVLHEYSSILVDDFAEKLEGEGRDLLLRIRRSASRMNNLLESLLTLSRVTKAELHKDHVDLSLIAMDIAEDLKARDRDREVEFRIAKGIDASCDENLMRIVLQNLMENAWKYSGKKEDPVVEFGEDIVNGGSKRFFVRDNGVGFDMADAERLFDPFKRLASGKDFPGTGVGLATVQRAIHRHGGKVWAEGQIETGATFYFTVGD